jgi:VanZ family protein
LLSFLTFLYVLLIVYGSLFPFTGWGVPTGPFLGFLRDPWPRDISSEDLVINVLVYIPLGLLLGVWGSRALGGLSTLALASLLGVLLSIAMEGLQTFFPGRVSSRLDVITNASGTLMGALLGWLVSPRTLPGARLQSLRREWFLPSRLVDVSLVALLLGMVTQLDLSIPSQEAIQRQSSMLPLWQTLFEPLQDDPLAVALCVLRVLGLGLFATLLMKPRKPRWWLYITLVGGALFTRSLGTAFKTPSVDWQLSFEGMMALTLGIALLWVLSRLNHTSRSALAGIAVLTSYAVGALVPRLVPLEAAFDLFNWIPFWGQMHNLAGLWDILVGIPPFLILGCLANLATPLYRRTEVAIMGTVLVIALVSGLEWAQQSIPGRSPDITDILIALGSWLIPWCWRPRAVSYCYGVKDARTGVYGGIRSIRYSHHRTRGEGVTITSSRRVRAQPAKL